MAVQDEIPKSRITLTYRTEINGAAEDIDLPLRLLVLGDLSQGTSLDRKVDLDERRMRTLDGANLASVMADMKMSVSVKVPNRIDPQNSDMLEAQIPITSMKSFQPDQIAKSVPKMRALLTLRNLLTELESNVGNSKEFRKLIADLYANPEAFNKDKEELKA